MPFLQNCWYVAAFSDEVVGDALVARTLCETPMVLFRDGDDAPVALRDACPHRSAPLSVGVYQNGQVQCRYHGLVFGKGGLCTHNPHGPITAALHARSWPAVDRHDLIWVWPGDPARADPAAIPDLSFIDATPSTDKFQGYMPTAANYQLCTDNILDLTHTDYLHPDTLGGGGLTRAKEKVSTSGDTLTIRWDNPGEVAPPALDREFAVQGLASDTLTQVIWMAPAVMRLAVEITPLDPAAGTSPIKTATMHIMTPETDMRTHYFVLSTRNFRTGDAAFNAGVRAFVNNIFLNEDKPMLEAQQARIGSPDLWSSNPAMLSIDTGAVRVRRILDRLIDAERPKLVA